MQQFLKFPQGFLWGTATSAHQVEGNNIHNDWWQAEQEGKVPFKSGKAANHYELYEKDFDLAQTLHQNAHRFSIEWSRVEPEEGKWNEEELEHYRQVLLALKERKMKTFVTLHHFTNPLWFTQLGGWEHSRAPFYFVRFVKMIAQKLGGLIDFYVTVNEPVLYLAMAYGAGAFPPFKKIRYLTIIKVFNNFVKAHQNAYKLLKQKEPAKQVGLAANLIDFQPRRGQNLLDIMAAMVANYFWNDVFLNKISQYLDFIGVNYYFHHHIRGFRFLGGKSESGHEITERGWGIHPEGLYAVLKRLKRYNRPLYVTENGIADKTDSKRSAFIIEHLKFLKEALEDGCDIKGYFYWSLIDNFEWEAGFESRFGLVEVDFATFKRTPRPSSKVYGQICKSNGIPLNLMR